MHTPRVQSVQFVVVAHSFTGQELFLSLSGVWFSSFDRARQFERITDAFAACRESREPGARVAVTYEGELLPGRVVPPSQVPGHG